MAWNDPSTWFQKDDAPAAPALPAPAEAPPPPPTDAESAESYPTDVPIGTSGLRRSGGYVTEELLTKLSGKRAAAVFREMSDNSAIVGAVMFVIEMLLRQVEWRTEPNPSGVPRAAEAKKFLDECFEDMDHTFDEFMAEVLSMLPFGWSYFEQVFKLRRGPADADPRYRSRHADGRIGLRKLAIRAQDTLERWDFADDGEVLGMWQQDIWSGRATVYLPMNRCLLFRTTSRKNNPEGRSLLRNAYRSWYYAKRIEEIEAIGIERDLTGLPVVHLPLEYLSPTATPAQKALRTAYQTLVQQIRRDEREGIVFPAETDKDGKATGYKLSLLTTGGRRAIDTSPIVVRHEQRIAMTMLAEFLFLGTGSVGSWSLASTKTALFATAVGGVMESIAATVNRNLVPRLMGLNGFTADEYPSLVYGDIETPEFAEIAAAINQLTQAGALVPDDALERKLREMLKLPERTTAVPEGERRGRPGAPAPVPPPVNEPGPTPAPPKPPPTIGPAAED